MPGSHVKTGLDVSMTEVPSNDRKERARREFEKNSTWWKFRKGFVSVGFYAVGTFPRVLVNRYVRKKPLHPDWSLFEEISVRTLKWLMDSPLPILRTNSGLLEFLYKTFRCPEPLQKVRGVPDVQGYWFGPQTWKGREAEATIFFLHGGGYVASTALWGTIPLCYLLKTLRKKHNIHARVLSLDYPLAPENMYPHAVDSAERAYRWLVEESGLPGSQQVFIAGDSAGGGLCLSLLQRISGKDDEKNSLQSPLGAILISPWVDLACVSMSYHTNAKYDFLPVHYTSVAAEYYVVGHKSAVVTERQKASMFQDKKDEAQVLAWLEHVEDSLCLDKSEDHENKHNQTHTDQQKVHPIPKLQMSAEGQMNSSKNVENPYKNPMISPVNASAEVLSHLPPMVVCYGGKEIFKDDIERFIQRLQKAKAGNTNSNESCDLADIKVIYDEDMVHDYAVLVDLFGARARVALKEMCQFMSTQLQISGPILSSLPLLKVETMHAPINSMPTKTKKLPLNLSIQHASQTISPKPPISIKQSISSKWSNSTNQTRLSNPSHLSSSTKQTNNHVFVFLKNSSTSPITFSSGIIQTSIAKDPVTDELPNSRQVSFQMLPSVMM